MDRERLYHVLLWTGDLGELFPEKRKDRERFLKLLRKARTSGDLRVYAYCLMRDRLQFLCSCPPGMIEKILASVEGVYRNYCQSKYRDKAPLWEHGMYECGWGGLIDLVRYVHRAPKRAEKPRRLWYKWSSHREYLRRNDQWADYKPVLGVYGKKDGQALKRYKRYVRRLSAGQPPAAFYLADADLPETSYVTKTAAEDARVESCESYESAVIVEDTSAEVLSKTAAQLADKHTVSGNDTKENPVVTPEQVIEMTAILMGVTPASMGKGGGVPQETAARRVALYILKEDARLTNAKTGRVLGMAASTVSRWYNNAQWREDLSGRIDRVRRQLIKEWHKECG